VKSARDEFGPPRTPNAQLERLLQSTAVRQEVNAAGHGLAKGGVTQDAKQAQLALVKNAGGDHSAHKDLAVKPGERAALSPCDGRVQANTAAEVKQAGQSLQKAGVTQSASQQQSAPAPTPSVPSQSHGRSR